MKKNDIEFLEGPIPPTLVAEVIGEFNNAHEVGAHALFVGQIRNDTVEGQQVQAIAYTAYTAMALETGLKILSEIVDKYQLHQLRVYHSLGNVGVGEISLFVIALSKHRRSALDSCSEAVERIKKELPVWGKEILEGDSHHWKKNT
ncbi:molybdenum cofactor biosynthesis protein MoaE [Pararhodonellum marinum]|uniref:molybdenum cofactor biosynthesis protein MoaE n=1 Tax=Pararhodonellum marinum TaxID=2755358 RepID=UPI001890A3D6|nr:molybdenum cofactor biosynthesis protein MoaE [Pararhodonellum marinum]